MKAKDIKKEDFVNWCINEYARYKDISIEESQTLLNTKFVDDYSAIEYLRDHYDVLHATASRFLVTDIEGFIFCRKKKDHNCLNCSKFSNYHEALICGDATHKLGKGFDISQGCRFWEKKGCKNWYIANKDGQPVLHELTYEEEKSIMTEDSELMSAERKDLARNVNYRYYLIGHLYEVI